MTRRTATVEAQAKVNLFLHILAREQSGFHQLETLFCRLELADGVQVMANDRGRSLDTAGPQSGEIGPVESNLAWRAAVAYSETAGWPGGFAIELDKRIPVGAGLGGGSADAGAVLRCLNALAPAPLSVDQLLGVAARLGADVPFLTQDRSTLALAWGRGERMLPLPPLPRRRCLVMMPGFRVSTADAYSWLTGREHECSPAAQRDLAGFTSWKRVSESVFNSFEEVVVARHPELGKHLALLRSTPQFDAVLMSGSGAAVVGFPAGDSGPAALPGWKVAESWTAEAVAAMRVAG
ncbi:MAG: 4-(cytidine 5'-diphospho)-2-C-methyl-D-erythritol kinase [Gemmatimonadota bacterium]